MNKNKEYLTRMEAGLQKIARKFDDDMMSRLELPRPDKTAAFIKRLRAAALLAIARRHSASHYTITMGGIRASFTKRPTKANLAGIILMAEVARKFIEKLQPGTHRRSTGAAVCGPEGKEEIITTTGDKIELHGSMERSVKVFQETITKGFDALKQSTAIAAASTNNLADLLNQIKKNR